MRLVFNLQSIFFFRYYYMYNLHEICGKEHPATMVRIFLVFPLHWKYFVRKFGDYWIQVTHGKYC